jgi:hypothetical protein
LIAVPASVEMSFRDRFLDLRLWLYGGLYAVGPGIRELGRRLRTA